MWEQWSTAASLVALPWTGVLPLPASNFDLFGLSRLTGALLLLFVLPGIALNRLVLRRYSFSAVATIAITLTLSLTAVIAAGFTLDLTPGGLRALSWAAILGAVTLGSLLVAFALAAFDRVRDGRAWKLQRFGFTGLRLLLGRAFGAPVLNSSDMGGEHQPRPFRSQAADIIAAARAMPGTLSGRIRGPAPRSAARAASNLARHRLGFAGVHIEARERRFWRATRWLDRARATGRLPGWLGGAGGRWVAGSAAPAGALPPQWPVLAVVPRRAGGGLIVHRFGFAGARLLFVTPEPTPPAAAVRQLRLAAVSLARWYENRRLRRHSTRAADRGRSGVPFTNREHRFGFSGARLLQIPRPVIDRVPEPASPGGGAEGQLAKHRAPELVLAYPSRRLRFSPLQLVLVAVALSLTSYAFLNAVSTVQSQRGTGFTQLWITTQRSASVDTLSIGVASQELDVTTFRLLLVSGDRTVAEWPALQLAPGQSFFARVDVDPATLVVPSVSVVLYRLDSPSAPYRLVQASIRP